MPNQPNFSTIDGRQVYVPPPSTPPPNMSTPSGPVYSPPPQAPNMSTPSGPSYSPPPSSGGGSSSRRRRSSGGGGGGIPTQAPNMSTPSGPVYSPPPRTTQIVRAPNMSTERGAVYAEPPQPNMSTETGPVRAEPPTMIKKAEKRTTAGTVTVIRTAPDGTRYLDVATPEEARKMKPTGPIGTFFRRFGQGARIGSGIDSDRATEQAYIEGVYGSYDVGYSLGGLFGFIGPIKGAGEVPAAARAATTAARATRAGQAVERAAQAVKATEAFQKTNAIYQAAQKNWLARNAISAGAALAQAEATYQVVTGTGKLTRTAEQRRLSNLPGYREAYGEAVRAQNEAVREQGILPAIANELPFVGNFLEKGEFADTFIEILQSRGVSAAEAQAALNVAQRERTFAGFAEVGGLLAVSRKSEQIGRREVAKAFERKAANVPTKKAGFEVFKRAAPQIGTAGFVEGSVQEITQQQSREMPFNFQDVGTMGAFGALSAGLLGGSIAGTRINRPGLSRTIEFGTNIADPFEKPGDLLQDAAEAINKRVTGGVPPTPVVTQTLSPSDFTGLGVSSSTSTKGKSSSGKGRRAPTPSTISFGTTTPAPTPVPTPVRTPTPTPAPSPVNIFGITGPTPTPIPPGRPVIPIFTPTPTPTDTDTPVPVPVPTPVTVPIPIPVNTPFLRVPPPVPFALDIPSGASLGGARTRKGYLNELAQSRALLADLGLVNTFKALNVPVPKETKKSKKSKQSRGLFENLDFPVFRFQKPKRSRR